MRFDPYLFLCGAKHSLCVLGANICATSTQNFPSNTYEMCVATWMKSCRAHEPGRGWGSLPPSHTDWFIVMSMIYDHMFQLALNLQEAQPAGEAFFHPRWTISACTNPYTNCNSHINFSHVLALMFGSRVGSASGLLWLLPPYWTNYQRWLGKHLWCLARSVRAQRRRRGSDGSLHSMQIVGMHSLGLTQGLCREGKGI